MTPELDVHLHGERIGTVHPVDADRRSVDLAWDADPRLDRIRLTESFTAIPGLAPARRLVSRFLGGYVPEGNQRQAMADQRRIPRDDLYAFLREYGGSIAGALTFRTSSAPAQYEELTASALRRMLKDAIGKQNQGTRDDSRSMIPGFQPKILLARFREGPWMLPHGDGHSTHILKPARPGAPERIVDEFYGHELARQLGLARFRSEVLAAGPTKFLAISRFDREVVGDGVRLIHQEDAAQAMALDWVDDQSKFQDRHRPRDPRRASAYRIAETLSGLDEDPVRTWFRQFVFRILIGDNDGHAKNVGIMHLDGSDHVSDLYDAVPSLFQEGRIDWTLALAADGEFDHRRITADHLIREARSWGVLRTRDIEETLRHLLADFRAALESVSLPAGASSGMRESLGRTVDRLLAGKEIGSGRR